MAQKDGGGSSDAEYITEWLTSKNYAARFYRVEARDFGSYPRRLRLYWVAYLNGKSSYLDAGQSMMDNAASAIASVPEAQSTQRLDLYLADSSCITCTEKPPKDDDGSKTFKYKDLGFTESFDGHVSVCQE